MAHQHSADITTPIPSIEEVGKSLGMDEARQQRIMYLVRNAGTSTSSFRVKANNKKSGSFTIKKAAKRISRPGKKSKSAAARG